MNFKHVSQKFQMFSDLAIKSNLGLFDKGRQTRRAMEIHKRAGVDSFYDLFLSVPDEEDTILKVLEVLRVFPLSIFVSMKRTVKIYTVFYKSRLKTREIWKTLRNV